MQTELAFALAKNATRPNPFEFISLQTTRTENNWKTEETWARSVVTLETEWIKGYNPWCLWWWWDGLCSMESVSLFVICFLEVIIISMTLLTRDYWFTVRLLSAVHRETACDVYRLQHWQQKNCTCEGHEGLAVWMKSDGCYVITKNCSALRQTAGEGAGDVWGAGQRGTYEKK